MHDSQETLLPTGALSAVWAAQGINAESLAIDSGGTLTRSAAQIAEIVSMPATPDARTDVPSADRMALELGPVIGRGGMGVVRLASQTALKRTVAVKQVAHPSNRRVSALVREARIAGHLEHPNILPIHALTEGPDGTSLVMKRIEGVPWSTVLGDPNQAPGGPPPEDLLAWQLRIFIRVCHAVHFAHTRGLLHLDIKPANVMLGAFDEVYLLDWGLATSIDPHAPAWMPRAGAIDGVLGTPGYMAPEQAIGCGAWIDARTDVYQLGAVLYELMTGRLRHPGTLMEALRRAFKSAPPVLDGDVPAELAAICRTALARHRDDRFASVDALRRAVDAFLEHRHATQLTHRALARLADREAEGADRRRIVDEVRFGLRLALRAWPEQPRARSELARLIRERAEQQLLDGALAAARASLAEMASPDAGLEARIAAAEAERAAAAAEAARLARDSDLNLYANQRMRWVMAIGLLWLMANIGWGAVVRSGRLDFGYRHLFGTSVVTLALFGAGVWRVRETLGTVAVERWIINAIGAGQIATPFLWLGAYAVGVPALSAVALSLPFYVFFMIVLAVSADVRVRWVPLALVGPAVAAPLWPQCAFEMAGIAGAICAVPAAWIWARDYAAANACLTNGSIDRTVLPPGPSLSA